MQAEVDFTNMNNLNNPNVYVGYTGLGMQQCGVGLLQVNRLKDYFSTCLPFIQKGAIPSVSTLAQSDIQTMLNNIYLDGLAVQNGGGSYFNPNITDSNGNALYNTSVNDN